MKNRNLLVVAGTLYLVSASAFGAGGLSGEAVGFFQSIFDMIMSIYPWAAAIALIFALFAVPMRGWGLFGAAFVAVFIIGVVKLVVTFASGVSI